MTPRKKVTDATKAKLPLPKGHPQRKAVKRKPTGPRIPPAQEILGYSTHAPDTGLSINQVWDLATPQPDGSRIIDANHPDLVANRLRGLPTTPSPIAGQPLPANPPTEDAPTFRAEPFAWNDPSEPFESEYARARVLQARLDARRFMPESVTPTGSRELLYDTRPYPWDIRRWLSHKLTALAKWVSP